MSEMIEIILWFPQSFDTLDNSSWTASETHSRDSYTEAPRRGKGQKDTERLWWEGIRVIRESTAGISKLLYRTFSSSELTKKSFYTEERNPPWSNSPLSQEWQGNESSTQELRPWEAFICLACRFSGDVCFISLWFASYCHDKFLWWRNVDLWYMCLWPEPSSPQNVTYLGMRPFIWSRGWRSRSQWGRPQEVLHFRDLELNPKKQMLSCLWYSVMLSSEYW